jgi:hypothetical protein
MASEYLFGIFKRSLETFFHFVRDLFYIQKIRGRVLTLGSILVYKACNSDIQKCIYILLANFQILANDHFLFF